jgi:repressor LexA
MRNRMTPARQRIYEYIKAYIAENEYPPSIREISGNLDIVISCVAFHLKNLEKYGYIRRYPNTARSIVVLDKLQTTHIDKIPERTK